jgi:hypothetical protein
MQLPEITIASQSLLNTGFRSANQVEVFSEVFSIFWAKPQVRSSLIISKTTPLEQKKGCPKLEWLFSARVMVPVWRRFQKRPIKSALEGKNPFPVGDRSKLEAERLPHSRTPQGTFNEVIPFNGLNALESHS